MPMIDLRLGDCLDIMRRMDTESVDFVITDPPYEKRYNYLWEGFAKEASRILKDRRNLVTILGHYQLPFVLDTFRPYLRYWWIGGMYHPMKRSKLFGKQVTVWWKPALWFVKGLRRCDLPDMPMDMIKPDDKMDKSLHKWQQPLSWFEHWIERLTLEGEIVLDPFMGSGTTGVACIQLGRNFIGCEIDPGYFEIAKRRIEAAQPVAIELPLMVTA